MTNTHACAAPGCTVQIRYGMLMCGDHWSEVPASIQRDVSRTWRTYKAKGGDANWDAYHEARTAAIEAVTP